LPSAPTQPIVISTTSHSVRLAWQSSSHSGHSPLRSYTLEYYSPEWQRSLSPGWLVLADNIEPSSTSYTVENLLPDTYYMFAVRGRNDQGFGPSSATSDLVKTSIEPQSVFRNKNSNELLEKALTGEVIQLNEPAEVLSSTSINITWKISKSAFLIEGFRVKYKPIGSKEYQVETINDNKRTNHVLVKLQKYTTYEILVEPFSGSIIGSESNVVQAKTKDDLPTHSPVGLLVHMESVNSISIKWQPLPDQHANGIILGYKITCTTNETKYNLNINTNSTTRGIILTSLQEGIIYCIKVAAYNRLGSGPYTSQKCVELIKSNLNKWAPVASVTDFDSAKATKSFGEDKSLFERFKQSFGEAWFLAFVCLASAALLTLISYLAWLYIKSARHLNSKKHHKYMSASSETGTLMNVPVKIDNNGNRYKLVHDAIWLDTLHSSSNNSNNQDCCCVPDLHNQLFVQKSKLTNIC
jgi:hypothetical protein